MPWRKKHYFTPHGHTNDLFIAATLLDWVFLVKFKPIFVKKTRVFNAEFIDESIIPDIEPNNPQFP